MSCKKIMAFINGKEKNQEYCVTKSFYEQSSSTSSKNASSDALGLDYALWYLIKKGCGSTALMNLKYLWISFKKDFGASTKSVILSLSLLNQRK